MDHVPYSDSLLHGGHENNSEDDDGKHRADHHHHQEADESSWDNNHASAIISKDVIFALAMLVACLHFKSRPSRDNFPLLLLSHNILSLSLSQHH